MALQVFTPPRTPVVGTGGGRSHAIRHVSFGDGYELNAGDGINSERRSVTLVWRNLSVAEFDQIIAFLDARADREGFLYTLPYEQQQLAWIKVGQTDETPRRNGRLDLSFTVRRYYGL